MPHRAAHRLRGHFGQPLLASHFSSDLSVGHGLSIRYRQHDVTDTLTERCGIIAQRRQKPRFLTGKIDIQPATGLCKQRVFPLYSHFRQNTAEIPLPVEP